ISARRRSPRCRTSTKSCITFRKTRPPATAGAKHFEMPFRSNSQLPEIRKQKKMTKRRARSAAVALAGLALAAFVMMTDKTTNVEAADKNPLAEWTGPYGGVPPFDKVKVEYFVPAFDAAMAEKLAEVDRITAETAAPT